MKTLLIHNDASQIYHHGVGKSLLERCRAMIALAQRRCANMDLREDVRELAHAELRHWRKKLITIKLQGNL